MIMLLEQGKIAPIELVNILKQHGKKNDFSIALTDEPILLIMVLFDVTDSEAHIIKKRTFELGLTIQEEIPFITLDYGNGFNFDFAIQSIKKSGKEYSNAINIILINGNDYIVKAMRIIGAEESIIETLHNAVNKSSMSKTEKVEAALKVQKTFTTQELHSHANKQRFTA